MTISVEIEEHLLRMLRAGVDHLQLPNAVSRPDGKILVYRDGVMQFLHRRLYEALMGPLGKKYLVRVCDTWGCQNPLEGHHRVVVRPAQSMAVGSIPWQEKNRQFCLKAGHPLDAENTYVHTDQRGYVHRQCRTCTLEAVHERRRLAKEANEKENT